MRIWEIAKPLCIKGKVLALRGYAKGNEMMDKVSFLQKPLHKKIVWSVIGFVLLWIVFPSGNGSKHSGLAFKESDFKRESSSKEMFYVKDGKDDGFKKVVPNLKRMPKTLSLEPLCNTFDPELASQHKKGTAYLNTESGFHCVVIYVGDGYVIVKPDSNVMYGNHCGYIETDDEYIEGQGLRAGFYALVGRRKVPLVNGSTRSMYAYVKLDKKSNQVALDAVTYNNNAVAAAEKENSRRYYAKKKHDVEVRNNAIDKALSRIAAKFKIRPIVEQLHLPSELKAKRTTFSLKDNIINYAQYGLKTKKVEELQQAIEKGNWRDLVELSGRVGIVYATPEYVRYQGEGSPEEIAESIMEYCLSGWRNLHCSNSALGKNVRHYAFISVAPDLGKAEKISIEDEGDRFIVPIRLCADVYVVPESEKDLLALLNEPSKLVSEFQKRYGSN